EHLDFTNPNLHDNCTYIHSNAPINNHPSKPTPQIPKLLHFIFGLQRDFGGYPFLFVHFMAIKMASDSIQPDHIYVHYYYEPEGYWWNRVKELDKVVMMKIDKVPDKVFGNVVENVSHQADVLRLQLLMKYGGIYIDSDLFIYRSLDSLLHHPFIMAKEDYHGMANAFIMSTKNSMFLHEWYNRYRSFNDSDWSGHSVWLPLKMSQERRFVGLVCALPRVAVFYPGFYENHVEFVHTQDEYIFNNTYQ
ncbi:hypothetical protein HDU76_012049, partial [Blyttiomyces sp. JEL0837]